MKKLLPKILVMASLIAALFYGFQYQPDKDSGSYAGIASIENVTYTTQAPCETGIGCRLQNGSYVLLTCTGQYTCNRFACGVICDGVYHWCPCSSNCTGAC